ncbi:hypothetical protein ILYODFUR_033497 [Ilyodon furcidens]|uniref:Uncharacterized protein n=1 Tax=Ilyodon furcidens TaxID=33524 RepID=A0ABV0TD68_9TELE
MDLTSLSPVDQAQGNSRVRKNEEPGEDWKLYDVQVLSRTDDYLKARQKLKASLTCNTSELRTEEVVRKRKIKTHLWRY